MNTRSRDRRDLSENDEPHHDTANATTTTQSQPRVLRSSSQHPSSDSNIHDPTTSSQAPARVIYKEKKGVPPAAEAKSSVVPSKQSNRTLKTKAPGNKVEKPNKKHNGKKVISKRISDIPWPQPKRFARGKERELGTQKDSICISVFLSEADLALMSGVDAVVLTRARRRASGAGTGVEIEGGDGGLVGGRRRRSSAEKRNGVNGGLSNGVVGGVNTILTTKVPTSEGSASSITSKEAPAKGKRKEEKTLERNIDNVVFGNVTFKAWYPSWYPKEIIGEKGLNGDSKGIVVSELYVCNKCFGYGKSVVEWVRHTRCCEKGVPGTRVYGHGEEGTWSVWEVDGSVDTLFCQNLSLFAKLFLDNKSVFFDVSGFNYFLLVHTNPESGSQQVIGFFSKEKMSWDNNNLACILIFPPWQRKSLGNLLMGISYSISRREGILGGPEKPISDLGKKGYKRYWGAEIAMWLLEHKESDKKKAKGYVTVSDVSQGTWIVVDDCLCILREMGVVEKSGKGKGSDGVDKVVIDKVRVREWVEREGLRLERVVDEGGFLDGYAMKVDEEVEVVDEEVVGD